MSRIIIDRHEVEPSEGEDVAPERLVIGWDAPLSTYFWQIMGSGENEGVASDFCGYRPSELPTWQMLMDSLPEEFNNTFCERAVRKVLEDQQRGDADSNVVIDMAGWPGWCAEVIADNSGTFVGNGIVTATKEEAERYARDLERRWHLVRAWRVVRCTDKPNYRVDLGTGATSVI